MKKLGLLIGSLVAVAAPVAAVVSCGKSNSSNAVANITTGDVKGFDFNKVEKNITSNFELGNNNKAGELIPNATKTSFKLICKAEEAPQANIDITADSYQAIEQTFAVQMAKKLVNDDNFKARLLDEKTTSTLFAVLITDVTNYKVKATKNIILPHPAKKANELDPDYLARVEKLITSTLINQGIVSRVTDIPMWTYDTASDDYISTSVKGSQVAMEGLRHPNFEADGTLAPIKVLKMVNQVIGNSAVREAVVKEETDYSMNFYDELYLSAFASSLKIGREDLSTQIVRQNSLVPFEHNSFEAPIAHIPMGVTDANRIINDLSTAINNSKFVKADANNYFDYIKGFDTSYYGLKVQQDNFDASHLDQAFLSSLANEIVTNNVIQQRIKIGSTVATVEVLSHQNFVDKYKTALAEIANPSINFLTSHLEDTSLEQIITPRRTDSIKALNWTDMDYKIFNAVQLISKYWWLDGAANDSTSRIKYKEIIDAVKEYQSTVANPTAAPLSQRTIILNELFKMAFNSVVDWEDVLTPSTGSVEDPNHPGEHIPNQLRINLNTDNDVAKITNLLASNPWANKAQANEFLQMTDIAEQNRR